jgi:hypothetical protein
VIEQPCANNCGEAIRRVTPADGLDPADFTWTHVSGGPYCEVVPVATPLEHDPEREERIPVTVIGVPPDPGPGGLRAE